MTEVKSITQTIDGKEFTYIVGKKYKIVRYLSSVKVRMIKYGLAEKAGHSSINPFPEYIPFDDPIYRKYNPPIKKDDILNGYETQTWKLNDIGEKFLKFVEDFHEVIDYWYIPKDIILYSEDI
jgi:hypothetical protein